MPDINEIKPKYISQIKIQLLCMNDNCNERDNWSSYNSLKELVQENGLGVISCKFCDSQKVSIQLLENEEHNHTNNFKIYTGKASLVLELLKVIENVIELSAKEAEDIIDNLKYKINTLTK